MGGSGAVEVKMSFCKKQLEQSLDERPFCKTDHRLVSFSLCIYQHDNTCFIVSKRLHQTMISFVLNVDKFQISV